MDDLVIDVPRKYLVYLIMNLINLPEVIVDKIKSTLHIEGDKLKLQITYEEADLIRDFIRGQATNHRFRC
jgi:hypothetical protein